MPKKKRETGFYYVKFKSTNDYDIIYWCEECNKWDIPSDIYDDLVSDMKVMCKVPTYEEWNKFRYIIN